MESIDKMRRYFSGRAKGLPYDIKAAVIAVTVDDVFAMLDSIEREVKALTDERDLLKRQWEAGVDFDQRLEACADKREDVTLFGIDYTALPVDADGVPIHVGDVMESDDGETFRVCRLQLFDSGWAIDGGKFTQGEIRHHHAPTVEDVLREFAQEMNENLGMYTGEAIDADEWRKADERTIAEYAAKLRLAGDE